MMKCKEVLKYVCENLDEEVKSKQCTEIRNHLKKCKDCTKQMLSLKRTVLLYKAYLSKPDVRKKACFDSFFRKK